MSEKESKCKTYECEKCNFVTTYANSYKRHVINNTHRPRILKKQEKSKKKQKNLP